MFLLLSFIGFLIPSWIIAAPEYSFSGNSGIIYSPNYPNNYDNNADIVYTISVPAGNWIHLTFLDFVTEEAFDYIIIENDDDDNNSMENSPSATTTYSGNKSGLSVSIPKSEAKMIFKSDLTNTFRGFAIQYDSVIVGLEYMPMNTCASPLHKSSFGIVTSPGFPGNYPNNISCSYLLIAEPDHIITLQFVAFNTEDGYDIVYVYDGSNNSAPLFGKFSGKRTPAAITSSSNSLYLFFNSDLVNNFPGFSALYTTTSVGSAYQKRGLQKTLTSSSNITSQFIAAQKINIPRIQRHL